LFQLYIIANTLLKGDSKDNNDDDDDDDDDDDNNNNNNNVLENDNCKLYWDRSVITDKTIPSNRPDITFINKTTRNTFLIDIAVPNTHNLAKIIIK
jgi:hypothetical protein